MNTISCYSFVGYAIDTDRSKGRVLKNFLVAEESFSGQGPGPLFGFPKGNLGGRSFAII